MSVSFQQASVLAACRPVAILMQAKTTLAANLVDIVHEPRKGVTRGRLLSPVKVKRPGRLSAAKRAVRCDL